MLSAMFIKDTLCGCSDRSGGRNIVGFNQCKPLASAPSGSRTDVLTVPRSGMTELCDMGQSLRVSMVQACTRMNMISLSTASTATTGSPVSIQKRHQEGAVSRKIALKRLTASDLTLFKWHYQNRPAGKQKAFNLDARVLVSALYPALGEPSSIPIPRYQIDLYLQGPGLHAIDNLQRKILKQQKNWRLNGELIDNPVDAPDRYNTLQPGDYALLEFSGERVPEACSITLIAAADQADAILHQELSRRYAVGSMWSMREEDVSAVLKAAPPQLGHPLSEWFESAALEDVVLGGAIGIDAVNRRRAGRGVTPVEFMRSKQAAEQTGVSGEEFLNQYFQQLLDLGQIHSFEWTSSLNAISPYDFRVEISSQSQARVVDAKSTRGDFSNPIHMSYGEILRAVHGPEPYDIFRIYFLNENTARMRLAKNIGIHLRAILGVVDSLPGGVTLDSISIRPDLLPFEGDEIILGGSYFTLK